MKTLCLILLGATMVGCSSAPKTSRAERAYYKYLKHAQVARQERHPRVKPPKNQVPLAPPLEQNIQPQSATASSSEQ